MAGLVERGGKKCHSKRIFLLSDHCQSEQSCKLKETAFLDVYIVLYKDVSVLVNKGSTKKAYKAVY